MEEIYIIKLKGLPSSSQESLRDSKASFYYRKDLTGEALLGFGSLHSFLGSTLVVLSIINLFLCEHKSEILGSGVWCGAIFAMAGLMGIITAQKRKTDISKSKIQVKIFFSLSIVTLMLTSTYLFLMIFDMKEPTANQYIASNISMSFIFELFTSLLSIFTCVRVIWPGSLACCAKDWPMQPKLKRKVIVSTQIHTNGVTQNEDLIRNLGPNCVISLSPPQTEAITRSDNYSVTNVCNQFVSMCECCDHDLNDRSDNCKSIEYGHNLESNSSYCENQEQYDSDEFDVENFDSIVEHEVSHITSGLQEDIELEIEQNTNDSNDENDCKYETIGQSRNKLQSNCLTVKDNIENCDYVQNKDSNVSPVGQYFTKSCEESKQGLTHV